VNGRRLVMPVTGGSALVWACGGDKGDVKPTRARWPEAPKPQPTGQQRAPGFDSLQSVPRLNGKLSPLSPRAPRPASEILMRTTSMVLPPVLTVPVRTRLASILSVNPYVRSSVSVRPRWSTASSSSARRAFGVRRALRHITSTFGLLAGSRPAPHRWCKRLVICSLPSGLPARPDLDRCRRRLLAGCPVGLLAHVGP
jgi:hypothetical protein